MPKEKNQHKSAAASDEKFRDFFTTTVADIPAEMVRREEETAEEQKGLFGRLFGHAKPKQAPQAGRTWNCLPVRCCWAQMPWQSLTGRNRWIWT